jgi:RNA polymerase sigma factor (sigma-70 family)
MEMVGDETSSGITDIHEARSARLIEGISRGDQDAFGMFFRLYGAAAFGLASRIIGDRGLAEEVVQEVFLSVWRKAGGYDPARGTVRSWILMQIHHRSVDVVRREEAERRRSTSNAWPAEHEGGVDDVVEEAWLSTRRVRVREALRHLSADHRTVIELAYFEGLTQTEVASQIKVPLGTVKSRTLAAMRRLRDVIGQGAT